jgi:hypothetical protein
MEPCLGTIPNSTMGSNRPSSPLLLVRSQHFKKKHVTSVSHNNESTVVTVVPAIVVLEQRFDGLAGRRGSSISLQSAECRVSTSVVCLSAGLAAVRASFWNKGRGGSDSMYSLEVTD